MSQSITPGVSKNPCMDKELDLGTFLIDGPKDFSSMGDLFNEIFDLSRTKAFPTGDPVTLSEWLRCGSFSISSATPGCGMFLNGRQDKPVDEFEDTNGIYAFTSIEFPENCCFWVNACLPYRAKASTCDFQIDGMQICIDGEDLQLTVVERC